MNSELPLSSTHHIVQVSGLRMHYVEAGEGEPLVLLHGFPETSYAWRKVMPHLASHFRVIAPDLRGCGDTDRPATGYDKRTVAADVYALVQHLGLPSIRLVGHDVGMMVAYDYAASHRAEVSHLVLMEAALPGLGLEEMYDALKEPRMWHLPLFEAPNALAESLIVGRELLFVEHFMRQQACQPEALDDCLPEYARRLAAPGALHGGIEYFRAHTIDAGRNREHAKQRLAMPVLTVGGRASFGEQLAKQIKPLVVKLHPVMIEDCGHYLAEEQPERLADALLAFLV